MTQDPASVAAGKSALRRPLLAARARRAPEDRAAAAAANTAHLLTALRGARIVCAYLPLPTEPLEAALLDLLVERGVSVLVPVVRADAPLDWCRHPAPTGPGAFGIAEPAGPRLGPTAVAGADAVLVPALAVDRAGRRLGRGGGHYDRTLALLRDVRPELVGVLFDGELLEHVPADRHDIAVTSVVTPAGGWHRLRR
ncbi:5-formyltetrahydrofolate cyclo-ligase [Nakamurella panacisegetis]|uniref:5-formyltetrahydrofolate cyclo-ligase n=1 Tax=Nakamurella panacisegetis TaxID=1090615 RepID=A0A1H0IV74_9ACTN|nr:5-formyltetrahydrofolate cyclo-ligase [Nakamurella panacisegetis]SDO35305.1 5-formyltetrahydrofolate cyclo-ligase [Nakamurella panacisegetis]